jgi:branched-chain amino acid transport system permease protein
MLAVRSNERAAAAAGLSVAGTKLAAYAIGSVIAGVAGTLYAYDFGTVSVARFSLFIGLGIVAFAYLGGITSIVGALIGGLLVTEGLMTHITEHVLGVPAAYQLIFGGLALIVAIVRAPEGLAGLISATGSRRVRLRRRTTGSRGPAVAGGDTA